MSKLDQAISKVIRTRLEKAGKRYFVCDNISDSIDSEEEIELLVEEATEKFEAFLDSLVIDRTDDDNSRGTAKRVAKMYIKELFKGRYYPEPDTTSFPNNDGDGEPYKGMLVTRTAIHSLCSHHHQAVQGTCYIGIIPGKKVIGLSKYSRIAQHHARRGTLQEELTTRIAKRIKTLTETDDVIVYIEATHGCCSGRGIMSPNSLTQTCTIYGQFNDQTVKQEFFQQIQLQKAN